MKNLERTLICKERAFATTNIASQIYIKKGNLAVFTVLDNIFKPTPLIDKKF